MYKDVDGGGLVVGSFNLPLKLFHAPKPVVLRPTLPWDDKRSFA